MHAINTIEEINGAGNCFWATYQYVGNNCWEISIYTDEYCEDMVESYVIPIHTLPNWSSVARKAFIEDTITHSVKYTIERL